MTARNAQYEINPLFEEAMAERAFKLGARFATVATVLYRPRPHGGGIPRLRLRQIADALHVRRISGQTPQEPSTALSSQMALHLSIVVDAYRALPKELPPGVRTTTAYEFYARQMATVREDGYFLDRSGNPLPAGGAGRDHPALPPLSLDRAAMYIASVVEPNLPLAYRAKCKNCQTPVWLSVKKAVAGYSCACCLRRLDSGRAKRTRSVVSAPQPHAQ